MLPGKHLRIATLSGRSQQPPRLDLGQRRRRRRHRQRVMDSRTARKTGILEIGVVDS